MIRARIAFPAAALLLPLVLLLACDAPQPTESGSLPPVRSPTAAVNLPIAPTALPNLPGATESVAFDVVTTPTGWLIAGSSYQNGMVDRPVVWRYTPGVTPVAPIELPNPRYGLSGATGVNSQGSVVGKTYLGVFTHATVWVIGSMYNRDIGTLGGVNSWANDINEAGVVVGGADNAAGITQAFVWSRRSGMVALPALVKGARSEAYSLNESGTVVGWSQNAQGCRRAVVWPTTGKPTDLGGLGGCESWARRIDAAGTIVGSAENPGQGWVPVMALPGKKFDQVKWRGPMSEAMALSEVGRIVGFAGDSVGLGLSQLGSGSPTTLTPLPGSPGSAGFAVELCGSVVGASHAGFVTWPSFSTMTSPHATLWFNYGRDCA